MGNTENSGNTDEEVDEFHKDLMQDTAEEKSSGQRLHTCKKAASLESLYSPMVPKDFDEKFNNIMKDYSAKIQTLTYEMIKQNQQIEVLQKENQELQNKLKLLNSDFNKSKLELKSEQEEKQKISDQLELTIIKYDGLNARLGHIKALQLEINDRSDIQLKELKNKWNAEEARLARLEKACTEGTAKLQSKLEAKMEAYQLQANENQEEKLLHLTTSFKTIASSQKLLEVKLKETEKEQKEQLERLDKKTEAIRLRMKEIQSQQNADQGKIKKIESNSEAVRTAQKVQLESIEEKFETIKLEMKEMQSQQSADQGKIKQIESKSEAVKTAQKEKLESIDKKFETIELEMKELESQQNADQEKIKQIESNSEAVKTAQKEKLESIEEKFETIKLEMKEIQSQQNADQEKIKQIKSNSEAVETTQKEKLESIKEKFETIALEMKEIQFQQNAEQGKIKQIEIKCESVETAQKEQLGSIEEKFETIKLEMKEIESQQNAHQETIKQIESKSDAVGTAQAEIQHKVADLEKRNAEVYQVQKDGDIRRWASTPGLQGVQTEQKVVCIMCKKESFLEAAEKCIGSVAESWKPSPKIISKKVMPMHVTIGEFQGAEFVVLVAVPEPRGIVLSNNEPCQLGGAYRAATTHRKKIMVLICVQGEDSTALAPSNVLHSSCAKMLESQPVLKILHKHGHLMSVAYNEYEQKPMKLNMAQRILLKVWAHESTQLEQKDTSDTISTKSFRSESLISVRTSFPDFGQQF